MKWLIGSTDHLINCVSSSFALPGCALVSASIQILVILFLFIFCICLLRGSEEKIKPPRSKTKAIIADDVIDSAQWSPTKFLNDSLDHELALATKKRLKAINALKNKK